MYFFVKPFDFDQGRREFLKGFCKVAIKYSSATSRILLAEKEKVFMPKGSISSGGARGGGATATAARGSFSSGVERSSGIGASSTFSSRGLASFGKTESRPSLSFGGSTKPSLSFENSALKSGASIGNKTGGFREVSGFKGTPLSSIRAESQPVTVPKASPIEVRSVMPQPTTNTRLDRLPSFRLNSPDVQNRPKVSLVKNIQPKAERPMAKIAVEPVNLQKVDLVKRVLSQVKPPESQLPKVSLQKAVEVPQIAQRELAIKPTIKVEPKISPITIATEKSKDVAVQQVNVHTRGLSELAYFHITPEDDEETKKKKINAEVTHVGYIAKRYRETGVTDDKKEALLKVRKLLALSPDKLASNSINTTPVKTEQDLRIKTDVQVLPSLQMETKKSTQIHPDTFRKSIVSSVGLVASEASMQTKAQVQTEIKAKTDTNAASTFKNKLIALEKKRKNKDTPKEYKLDERALNNRIKQWGEAIRSVFPAWDILYKARLSDVARNLQGPTKDTDSGLIAQIGKRVDGSNNSKDGWREPLLTSDAEVTASQAKLVGEYEIFSKVPVVIKESGSTVKDKDIQLVLAGDDSKEDYDLAA